MAFRNEVFHSVGLFDETLSVGTPQMGGEDMDFFFRIFRRGYDLSYSPYAKVFHRHRERIDGYRHGRATGCFLRKHLYDRYIMLQFVGRPLNRLFALLGTMLRGNRPLSYLEFTELVGHISAITYHPSTAEAKPLDAAIWIREQDR
jgi:GT2 family glycosyltransferase